LMTNYRFRIACRAREREKIQREERGLSEWVWG